MRKSILLILLTLSMALSAMTPEQEQRFKYYYYEAVRLFQAEDYQTSYKLFRFLYQLDNQDAGVNLYLGLFSNAYHDQEGATTFFRQAYLSCPEEYWLQYAAILFQSQDKASQDEAIKVLNNATRLQPDNSEVWDNLRQAYAAVGRYKDALHAQDEIDRLTGYNAYSAFNRYQMQMMLGQPKKAMAELDRYLAETPNDVQFLIYKTELSEAMHLKAKKLIPLYERILHLDPRNATTLNNYAYLLATHKGDLNRAESMSRQAIQQEPQDANYLDTYAWILFLNGEQALAQMYIRRAIECYKGKTLTKEVLKHAAKILNTK